MSKTSCKWFTRSSIVFAALLATAPAQELKIEKVDGRLGFAEGPVWSRDNYLLVTDSPHNKIIKYAPGEKSAVFRENSDGANGLTFDAQGRLYLCEAHSRRLTRIDKKGKLEVLADKWKGKRLNAPNDVVVRRDGQIYFTDPAFGNQQDARELDFFGVFHITPKGEMSIVAKPTGRPNGIALSPDGRTLYVTNSDEGNVRAYDVDKKTGDTSNERIVIAHVDGVPDGMRVAENGNLYVTGSNVFVYDPAGKLLTTIPIGETPSNVAFGDADLQALYVTTRTSVYRIRLDVKGSIQY